MEVTLREVTDDDLPHFFEQQRDPAYDHMAAFTRGDPDDRDGFLAHWAKVRADPTILLRTILLDGQVVGSVGSFVLFGAREVTYGVAREHWGKGVATEALRLFLALFPERPLHARAAADNVGSRRVLEKCGFQVTGRDEGFARARGQMVEEVVLRLDA
ncbi:MAG: GNAT family N-acetyltransferase [Planctomycetes bacterium]|nr:GNAT family N-acetyltransferase [Planctomycetota bacterium]